MNSSSKPIANGINSQKSDVISTDMSTVASLSQVKSNKNVLSVSSSNSKQDNNKPEESNSPENINKTIESEDPKDAVLKINNQNSNIFNNFELNEIQNSKVTSLYLQAEIDKLVLQLEEYLQHCFTHISNKKLKRIYLINPLKEFEIFQSKSCGETICSKIMKQYNSVSKSKKLKEKHMKILKHNLNLFYKSISKHICQENKSQLIGNITNEDMMHLRLNLNIEREWNSEIEVVDVLSISKRIDEIDCLKELIKHLKEVLQKKNHAEDILALTSNQFKAVIQRLNSMDILGLYKEILRILLWCEGKLHRRFLFIDYPLLDEKSLTKHFIGKPFYLSEPASKFYEKYSNICISEIQSVCWKVGILIQVLCICTNKSPYEKPIKEAEKSLKQLKRKANPSELYDCYTNDISMCERKEEVIEYNPQNLMIQDNRLFITYFVPEIGSKIKKLEENLLYEVKKCMWFGNNIPNSAKLNISENDNFDLKLFLESIYGQRGFEMTQYDVDSNIIKIIQEFEEGYNKNFKKFIHKSIESNFENAKLFVENNDQEIESQLNKKLAIEGFPWTVPTHVSKVISSIFRNRDLNPLKSFKELRFNQIKTEEKQLYYLLELYFGSVNPALQKFIHDNDKVEDAIKMINYRRTDAIRLLNNIILCCDESSKYQSKIINFIDQENRLSDLRVGSQQIVGLQINRLPKEINPYKEPFEALWLMTSTRARLITVSSCESLTSHPEFKIQAVLKGFFGFSVDENSEIKSYLSKKSNLCDEYRTEQRLSLVPKVFKKIGTICLKLEPILQWRCLQESRIRNMQEINKTCKTVQKVEENQHYKSLLILMYFYSLIKHLCYDFDSHCRLRLFCSCKTLKLNSKEHLGSCLCLYGLDNPTITKFLNGGFNREEIIEEEISNYFEINEGTSFYRIKQDYQKQFMEQFVDRIGIKMSIDFIQKVFRVKLDRS